MYLLPDSKNIVSVDNIMSGSPTIKGTRLTTSCIYGLFLGGEKISTIKMLYPYISFDQIKDAIRYEKLNSEQSKTKV
jgi:uncharacterized protein (DUF433 family)